MSLVQTAERKGRVFFDSPTQPHIPLFRVQGAVGIQALREAVEDLPLNKTVIGEVTEAITRGSERIGKLLHNGAIITPKGFPLAEPLPSLSRELREGLDLERRVIVAVDTRRLRIVLELAESKNTQAIVIDNGADQAVAYSQPLPHTRADLMVTRAGVTSRLDGRTTLRALANTIEPIPSAGSQKLMSRVSVVVQALIDLADTTGKGRINYKAPSVLGFKQHGYR